MAVLLTLRTLSREMGCHHEALRTFVRRRPALAGLGRWAGNARVYALSELKKIRAAYEKRAAALAK
jgi:hypothetical protein